jgi:hypothetical protein
MKNFFLIMMMFLLPYQYAWAMVVTYDVHDTNHYSSQVSEVHFGHHIHSQDLHNEDLLSEDLTHVHNKFEHKDSKDTTNQECGKHFHSGFSHLSCGELLNASLLIFEVHVVQYINQYALVYQSPTPYALERPKWLQSI